MEKNEKILTPQGISDFLQQYIVGQEQAKKTLASAVATHYLRVQQGFFPPPYEERPKSNVLLIGSTGTGKTRMIELLAQYVDIPVVTVDATTYSETGYVGKEVEEMVFELLKKADYNIEKAETGIIHIDEVDKIAKTSDAWNHDVSREGVQRGLLRLLESSHVTLKGNKKNDEEQWEIATENVLFILSGAFEGLQEIIKARLKKEQGIGYGKKIYSQQDIALLEPTFDDLVQYGMSPQLLGRVPSVALLHELQEEDLCKILSLPTNGLIQKKIEDFYLAGTELEFTQEALFAFAKKASSYRIGARALRKAMDEVLDPFLFLLSTKEIPRLVVDKQTVEFPGSVMERLLHASPERKKEHIFPALGEKRNLLPSIYQHQLELLGISAELLVVAAAYGKSEGLPPKALPEHIKKAKENIISHLQLYEQTSGIRFELSEEAQWFLVYGCLEEKDLYFGQKECSKLFGYVPEEFKQKGTMISVSLREIFEPQRLTRKLLKKKNMKPKGKNTPPGKKAKTKK